MTRDNVTPPPRPLECQFIAGYPSPLPTSDPPISGVPGSWPEPIYTPGVERVGVLIKETVLLRHTTKLSQTGFVDSPSIS